MPEYEQIYSRATRELVEQRNRLAPGPAEAFRVFSKSVFAEVAIPAAGRPIRKRLKRSTREKRSMKFGLSEALKSVAGGVVTLCGIVPAQDAKTATAARYPQSEWSKARR